MSTVRDARTQISARCSGRNIRGAAIMFCLWPPTRLALGTAVPKRKCRCQRSLNLMRNLGGAIGIALIDTFCTDEISIHAMPSSRLLAGDVSTARKHIGLDPDVRERTNAALSLTPNAEAHAAANDRKGCLCVERNDAWAMLAAFALLGVLVVPFAWRTRHASAVAIKAALIRRESKADCAKIRSLLRDESVPAYRTRLAAVAQTGLVLSHADCNRSTFGIRNCKRKASAGTKAMLFSRGGVAHVEQLPQHTPIKRNRTDAGCMVQSW